MPSLFKALLLPKPTARGLKFVKTSAFLELLQHVAHDMLTQGKSWDDVDVQLRDITIRELLPHRKYDADAVADFYRAHWRLIDSSWLPAVQLMKETWLKIAADPAAFIREFGLSQMR